MNARATHRSGKSRFWLVASILLMLVGMMGSSFVQTSGGDVTVKDLKWQTANGLAMSGLIFVPDGVTEESPAPAIVVSHGMYNNREMQDLNFVELSRRGFVVLSMDMYSHGKSEPVGDITQIFPGMYQAVAMLAGIDYVDSERIGITGHSLGGMSSNVAVQIDNAMGTELVSAVLVNSADAVYADDESGEFVDIYGSRDVGIMAGKYDEWFFVDVDDAGNPTAPRDFLQYNNAQSFLHFGADPEGLELRDAETVYYETIDGDEAMRVIYNPTIIHPWAHFSKQSTEATADFFSEALGAPNPIPGDNQVWQWKVVFNTIGLIGFGIFLVAFALQLTRSRFFSSLRSSTTVTIRETDREGKMWLWGTLAIGAIAASVLYLPIITAVKGNTNFAEPWAQSSPWGIGVWAATNGVITALMLTAFYFAYMKKKGITLRERGITMPWSAMGKTVLLSVTTAAAAFAWVFIADYFFNVDFRIWVVAAKAFEADTIGYALFPPLLLLLVFFVMASIAANSINFVKFSKKTPEWVNTTVLAAINTIPAAAILLVQYISFVTTGHLQLNNMYVVWLFPLLVYLPVSTIMSRKIYRETNNPYIGGMIVAIVVALISSANTLTWAT